MSLYSSGSRCQSLPELHDGRWHEVESSHVCKHAQQWVSYRGPCLELTHRLRRNTDNLLAGKSHVRKIFILLDFAAPPSSERPAGGSPMLWLLTQPAHLTTLNCFPIARHKIETGFVAVITRARARSPSKLPAAPRRSCRAHRQCSSGIAMLANGRPFTQLVSLTSFLQRGERASTPPNSFICNLSARRIRAGCHRALSATQVHPPPAPAGT